jgi:reverse gyrase
MNSCGNLLYDENEASKRKKVVFIVPTNNLVDQQSSVIERYTEKVRVGKFQGKLTFYFI